MLVEAFAALAICCRPWCLLVDWCISLSLCYHSSEHRIPLAPKLRERSHMPGRNHAKFELDPSTLQGVARSQVRGLSGASLLIKKGQKKHHDTPNGGTPRSSVGPSPRQPRPAWPQRAPRTSSPRELARPAWTTAMLMTVRPRGIITSRVGGDPEAAVGGLAGGRQACRSSITAQRVKDQVVAQFARSREAQ
jgi:hypothetical protein